MSEDNDKGRRMVDDQHEVDWYEFFAAKRAKALTAVAVLASDPPRDCWKAPLRELQDILHAWFDAISSQRVSPSGLHGLDDTIRKAVGIIFLGFHDDPERDPWNIHSLRHQIKCLGHMLRGELQMPDREKPLTEAWKAEQSRLCKLLDGAVKETGGTFDYAHRLYKLGLLSESPAVDTPETTGKVCVFCGEPLYGPFSTSVQVQLVNDDSSDNVMALRKKPGGSIYWHSVCGVPHKDRANFESLASSSFARQIEWFTSDERRSEFGKRAKELLADSECHDPILLFGFRKDSPKIEYDCRYLTSEHRQIWSVAIDPESEDGRKLLALLEFDDHHDLPPSYGCVCGEDANDVAPLPHKTWCPKADE